MHEYTEVCGRRRRGPGALSAGAAQPSGPSARGRGAARDLTGRETECCSFFTFTFAPAGGALQLDVEVPAGYAAVLDALARRAAAGMRR
jgi:hypothetical protein